MQLFYAPDITPPHHTLPEEESRHCVKVLRMRAGEVVHLTDGRGNLFEAQIVSADPRRCEVEVMATTAGYGRHPYQLTMAVAPTKNIDRFEWFLEKATEIGVDSIVPLLSQNSERRVLKPERAEKVIVSAAKLSLKAYFPVLEPLTDVKDVIIRPFAGAKLIAHCREDSARVSIMDALAPARDALILIGPEGDFTAEEVALARSHGFIEISLGTSRLRTETAALVATTATYLRNEDE
ncbi:MAG: 16S rRNA (uracil(1498)-N(3))-methyltransferase [Rikenellaceae bacterium]|jgi:16S rRNA (uracil1498-N3)-methyltransferase|nr:16S rRNA (uracil(1498)-N(3))-methyltransferase [Rikenellaceae bacterium]